MLPYMEVLIYSTKKSWSNLLQKENQTPSYAFPMILGLRPNFEKRLTRPCMRISMLSCSFILHYTLFDIFLNPGIIVSHHQFQCYQSAFLQVVAPWNIHPSFIPLVNFHFPLDLSSNFTFSGKVFPHLLTGSFFSFPESTCNLSRCLSAVIHTLQNSICVYKIIYLYLFLYLNWIFSEGM